MSESLSRAELDALDLSSVQWGSDPIAGEGVEVAKLRGGAVALRGKDDPGTVIRYTEGEWQAYLVGARDGEFDL